MEHVPNIIAEAAKSPIGIVALIVLVIGFIAWRFFSNDGTEIKLGVFAILMVGAGLAIYAVMSVQELDCSELDNLSGEELQQCLDRQNSWQ